MSITSPQQFYLAGNGTTVNIFTPVPGVTTYNFVVIGGGGGGGYGAVGGSGSVVTATYTDVTNPLTILIGGGGVLVYEGSYGGGGGGLTQVFSTQVNVIAGGGGGGGANGPTPSSGAGGSGCTSDGSGVSGNSPSTIGGGGGGGNNDGAGGTGSGGEGGSFSNSGTGGAGGNNGDAGGGGGGAGLNGSTGNGGNPNNGGGFNGGGGCTSYGGGGGAGFGGGGGGGAYSGGGSGSSVALLAPSSVTYSPAPYNGLTYGRGGANSASGSDGYVEISWVVPLPTPTPTPTPTPSPSPPISNICFPAGTPIKTDQGIVAIDHIDTAYHTIGGKRILDITQTVSLDRFLVKFNKDCLGPNWPSADTIMTKEHKVLYTGKLAPAYKFLNISSDVKRVKYTGEIVYNVLMEKHELMNVNNLICETLHPDNLIAKIYRNRFTDDYNERVIYIMNDALERRKFYEYKTIVNRIHTATF